MNHQGMTFIECLIVLSIVALLMSMVQPGFAPLVSRQQSNFTVAQLHQLLRFARARAVSENSLVTACPSDDATHCKADGREWLVFIDNNANEQIDSGERLLRQLTLPTPWQPRLRLSAGRQYVQFRPVGMANGTAGKVYACHPERGESVNYVTVALSGRISLKNSNKTTMRGAPLDCG